MHLSRRRLVTTVPALAALASLAACSSSASEQSSGASDAGGGAAAPGAPADLPDGWTWVEGTDVPTADASPSLPVTVTDGTGTEVTIEDLSRTIVGGEDVADMMAALGLADLIYAAPTNSVAQAALDAPEQYEFSQQTGTEGLLSVDGTCFIGNNVKRHGDVAEQFRSAGLSAAVVDGQQAVVDKIRSIGELIGDPEAGEELAAAVEAQLAEASDSAGDGAKALRVLVVTSSGAGGANAVVGTGTAAADILEAVGAVNCGVEAGLRGYSVEFSDEGLLDLAPDVIITGTGDLEEWGGFEGFLEAFPTLAQTPAGQANSFVLMPSEQIKVSGSAVGAGAVALAAALADLAA
ncbi:MAG: ABC transporter substrate-binding protein [Brachybacterium sp.]|nr:ABC transporter substrate-binding protein [Brachybacterium sp.]MDN6329656.1 ABC transporter substrate-binding protein [Brachybacterium sp.]